MTRNDEPAAQSRWLTIDRFEGLAERASEFASGPWGTHAGFGLLGFWICAAVFVGWNEAYGVVDEVATMSSFLLLFLLQRSQAKQGLAMQVKLDELLVAVKKASPGLIDLEDRPEAEVQAIHDRFQELQARPGVHSIVETTTPPESVESRVG